MKPGEKLYWNHHFAVEISMPRTWIRWGYVKGNEKPKPFNVLPKKIRLGLPGGDSFDYEPKLSGGFESDGVKHRAEVVDEVKSWAWRFYSLDGYTSGEWSLAESKEDCLRQAKDYFRERGLIPEAFLIVDDESRADNLPLDAEWQEFAKEAFAAVDSWRTGKGWPKGWKGKE